MEGVSRRGRLQCTKPQAFPLLPVCPLPPLEGTRVQDTAELGGSFCPGAMRCHPGFFRPPPPPSSARAVVRSGASVAGWLQEVDGGPQPLAASAWGWEVGGLGWAWPVLSLHRAHSLPPAEPIPPERR